MVVRPKVIRKRDIAKRWTPTLVKDGWTPISDFFLRNYARLQPPLTSLEAMLVVHLMTYKWDEAAPFPAFKTLAKRMGVSVTAVRARARHLEGKKYLRRIKRVGGTNRFDLRPLFAALEKLQAQSQAVDDHGTAAAG